MSIIDFWILLLLCIKKASDTGGIWRSIGGTWSLRKPGNLAASRPFSGQLVENWDCPGKTGTSCHPMYGVKQCSGGIIMRKVCSGSWWLARCQI